MPPPARGIRPPRRPPASGRRRPGPPCHKQQQWGRKTARRDGKPTRRDGSGGRGRAMTQVAAELLGGEERQGRGWGPRRGSKSTGTSGWAAAGKLVGAGSRRSWSGGRGPRRDGVKEVVGGSEERRGAPAGGRSSTRRWGTFGFRRRTSRGRLGWRWCPARRGRGTAAVSGTFGRSPVGSIAGGEAKSGGRAGGGKGLKERGSEILG
ncbi:hypothetical protein BRADI_1g34509v3 [Brachypodium distachyon]|uniref:Uncharacterized protein n=1 Tax=Brachypodium distachyon TaxID=15368 RepID=A0A2K2DMQ3_BRADI|nr:hypothetical protein BRADI_1g34509v3 [Brachypodium distachyon]